MSTSPRLLVTGATGQLGGLIIDMLSKTRPATEIAGLVREGEGRAPSKADQITARGVQKPLFQSLNYPMIDDRNDTPSAREISGLGVWDGENNLAAWKLILGDAAGGPDVSPYAAPARTAAVHGLPPTCIIVGELDVFRDEDVAYATRLLQSGIATALHVFPGAYHAWDLFAPDAGLTAAFFQTWFGYLQRAFRR